MNSVAAIQDYVPVMVAALGGGLLAGYAAYVRARSQAGRVIIDAAEDVVLIQKGVIADLREEVAELKKEVERLTKENRALRKRVRSLEKHEEERNGNGES